MESVKERFPIAEDYSVSETTLEQVFLSFAKQQIGEEGPAIEEDDPPSDSSKYGTFDEDGGNQTPDSQRSNGGSTDGKKSRL